MFTLTFVLAFLALNVTHPDLLGSYMSLALDPGLADQINIRLQEKYCKTFVTVTEALAINCGNIVMHHLVCLMSLDLGVFATHQFIYFPKGTTLKRNFILQTFNK